jgi:hypothetical protein
LHLDAGFCHQLLDLLPAAGGQRLVAEQLLEPVSPHLARPSLADADRLGDRLDDLGRVFLFPRVRSLSVTQVVPSTAISAQRCPAQTDVRSKNRLRHNQ